jgi:branched-chain amino acid transport system ATP-binding protein
MLRIENLNVSIGSVAILRNVALSVEGGEFAGLIGRNGAGKTTLMRSIMGILPAQAGTITFDGAPLTALPVHGRAKLGIGYMPEDRRLIPDLTVEENILLPAWAIGLADATKRLATVYELVPEAREFAQRKGLQLSGGQQKLAALARALMCGTRLLLLDEPFEGVAPVLARRLVDVIGRLKREGLSVILSESDLAHSSDMLDTVHLIDRGAVVQGRLEQVE